MVERYVALAYDKQQVHSAADLPKPLLWPKLAVSRQDITTTLKHFSLSTQRPAIGFVRGDRSCTKTLASLPLRDIGTETY